MDLRERVVVVTGGASGIGAHLCRRLVREEPAAIVVVDRDRDGAEAVALEVGGTAVVADLGTQPGVEQAVADARAVAGRIDLYCSNAGVAVGGGPEADDDGWQVSWDVNLMAHVRASRLLLPEWLERGEGYLLGTISAAGLLNHILAAPYAATKAAALSFYEYLAIAHDHQGVRVSALCPQGVRTPMLEEDPSGFLLPDAMDPADVADITVAAVTGDEPFLILPHPEVAKFMERRGADHARWLEGMRRLRAGAIAALEQQA